MTRNIILYSNEIDEIILIKTIKTFLEIPKIKNDYFEFFKLNIIDIIIRKFTNSNSEFLKEKHLEQESIDAFRILSNSSENSSV